MRRVLTIGVLLAVGLPIYGKQESGKPSSNQKESKPAQPPPSPPTRVVTCVIKQDGTTIECEYPEANPPSYLRRLFSAEGLPNLLLVGVGLGGIGVAVGTLKKIGTQTDAMKNQVVLMREQMDVMIQRERGRLSLDVQPVTVVGDKFGRLISCVELTNSGHSNAYILFSAAKLVVVPSGQWPLPDPDPDQFSTWSKTIEPSETPLYAPVDTEDIPASVESFGQEMANGTLSIYFYGFIEYETLGIKWRRDFGYVWKTDESSGDAIFPRRRNTEEICVAGWWEQDLRHKNTEYEINPN